MNNVSTSLTDSDKRAIEKIYIPDSSGEKSYEEQIAEIRAIQRSVLKLVPIDKGIEMGTSREPESMLTLGYGLCYDRSRAIEKTLTFYNYKVRHISIHSIFKNFFSTIFKKGVYSHAVTEVLTKKGWIVVDSNEEWVSLDQNGLPISAKKIRDYLANNSQINWEKKPSGAVYGMPMIVTYGLYSRHGKFYPPYIFFPDINLYDFSQNFIEF